MPTLIEIELLKSCNKDLQPAVAPHRILFRLETEDEILTVQLLVQDFLSSLALQTDTSSDDTTIFEGTDE